MTCPQVADGGDGLKICRVAANILNKQLWTASSGWSSAWELGIGLKLLVIKNKFVTKGYKGPWIDDLNQGKWL
jgi:hypothetical protein